MALKTNVVTRRRLRIAAAEDGLVYSDLLDALLDRREREIARERARQVSPLHRPRPGVAGYAPAEEAVSG
jgi:hypothetical protein